MTAISADASAQPATPANATSPVRVGVRAGVTAIVSVIVLHIVGTVAGVSWLLSVPGAGMVPVTLPSAVTSAIIPITMGTVVLFIAQRSRRAVTVLAWAGPVIGVVTVAGPLSAGGDLLARVLLAIMHVVVGLAWFRAVHRGGVDA